MKKTFTIFCLLLTTLTFGQSFYDGFDDGFQSTCDDAMVSLITPTAPHVICPGSNEYSCGYREGVKTASKAIERLKSEGSAATFKAVSKEKTPGQELAESFRGTNQGSPQISERGALRMLGFTALSMTILLVWVLSLGV